MRISKQSEYAIFMLVHLAAHPEEQPIPAQQIAEAQGLPPNMMPQLSSVLSKQGWIRGKRGPGGGLSLVADPAELSVAEVVRVVEGPIAITNCLLRDDACPNREGCPLHRVWHEAQYEFVKTLESVSIEELATRHG
jgi:Rrf2 family protein